LAYQASKISQATRGRLARLTVASHTQGVLSNGTDRPSGKQLSYIGVKIT